MPINFDNLLQLVLIVLLVVAVAALIQLIIILLDIRQVTKKFRQLASLVNLIDCFFDGDEVKQFLKQCRRSCAGGLEFIMGALGRLAGFYPRSKEKKSNKGR
jgi:hypothetical protein